MTCPEITMVVRTYQVCALTMFALSQNFRVVVLDMICPFMTIIFKNYIVVRLLLYISCTMVFALISIIYPRITMIGLVSTMLFDLIPNFISYTHRKHNVPAILVQKQLTIDNLIGRN